MRCAVGRGPSLPILFFSFCQNRLASLLQITEPTMSRKPNSQPLTTPSSHLFRHKCGTSLTSSLTFILNSSLIATCRIEWKYISASVFKPRSMFTWRRA
ncbi:hypothetical protein JAAARDRAFT_487340 [Jaapia argillacea MUCL 33604]|uniref:Uncharacterized protein n=1 Tax=Jaapia argillacea MUCL 33604 TaxID=933084 RepID=A0A067PM61_9AGAM|nr:hypothetical protein JAAARDRAFT_487340 [Jaapia argillacea MUCL 33604]